MAAALGSQIGQFVERKRAEVALGRSETTYRSLVEGSHFGIFRSTPDGRLLAVNPALVSMLGYESEAQLLERNMERDIFVDPAQRRRLVAEVTARGNLSTESVWRRRDGKTVTVRASGRAVRAAPGRAAYFHPIVWELPHPRLP